MTLTAYVRTTDHVADYQTILLNLMAEGILTADEVSARSSVVYQNLAWHLKNHDSIESWLGTNVVTDAPTTTPLATTPVVTTPLATTPLATTPVATTAEATTQGAGSMIASFGLVLICAFVRL